MNTYIIEEKQNLQSTRTGSKIEAKSLTAAKRKATRNQCFHGTVLVIKSEDGSELCYKTDGSGWSAL